ncbi:MAG: OmpH family outer membrane protein [Planctomycetota bacterium]
MGRAERIFVYLAALIALAAGLGSLAIDRPAIASSVSSSRVATVNVLELMQESMQQPSFLTERESLAQGFTAEVEQAEAEIQRLQQEIQLAGPTSPQSGALRQQYQIAAQTLQQIGQRAQGEFQQLSARQAALAYENVHAAADRVAANEGYELVFASNRDGAIQAAENLTAVTQEILARPLLFGAIADDVTPMVRAELGLPDSSEAADDASAEPASPMTDQP